jgi:hypothetical protein
MLRTVYSLGLLGLLDLENGDNTIICNVGKYFPNFTGHHSIKRLESLATPFTEPKISQLLLSSWIQGELFRKRTCIWDNYLVSVVLTIQDKELLVTACVCLGASHKIYEQKNTEEASITEYSLLVHFDTFRYISAHFGTFRYISVHFGTFRYISVHFGTILRVSLQILSTRYMYRYEESKTN